jgi:hypothetical protein
MVHIIPLFVGERRLDTGNAVQYPDSSPIGEAMQQFGDRWQAAAERYEHCIELGDSVASVWSGGWEGDTAST